MLAVLAVLALALGGVVGVVTFGVLDLGREPPQLDDLRVTNDDETNHTVRVAVFPANESGESPVFETAVTLEPGETSRFDGATEEDTEYRLAVTVDDRESESFDVAGPDDLCTTTVQVESNATVDVYRGCA